MNNAKKMKGLGQGATMIAAFWGVFIWKEFRTAPKSVILLQKPWK